MIAKLRDLGIHIEWQRVLEIDGSGSVCRPHIAQAILDKDYTADEISRLVNLADKYGLIASDGSDYRGLDVSHETIIGGVDVPIKSAEQLMALAEQRELRLASP